MTGYNDKIIYIMQGIPGSGKSTLAAMIQESYLQRDLQVEILSTDNFFMKDGFYDWNPSLLGRAHQWNQNRARSYMMDDQTVIIDNTNIKRAWAEPYLKLAEEFGYTIQVVRVFATLEECLRRNALRSPDRRCPEEIIRKRYYDLEDLTDGIGPDTLSSTTSTPK